MLEYYQQYRRGQGAEEKKGKQWLTAAAKLVLHPAGAALCREAEVQYESSHGGMNQRVVLRFDGRSGGTRHSLNTRESTAQTSPGQKCATDGTPKSSRSDFQRALQPRNDFSPCVSCGHVPCVLVDNILAASEIEPIPNEYNVASLIERHQKAIAFFPGERLGANKESGLTVVLCSPP
jgi:hypothetical protein